ncbi:UDP-glucose pyrophosphorylase [Streptomyces sp. Ag109_O5-1]|uniref:UTP--glucose-1-phosphate uridylyltransferase n=1 Tax=Streptomyces sp. Ag109_O5-1 TaxID=1938851 RepID=UPI000F4FEAD1|nr:UTP--glucose-1-phosphate uridylyltransferase [Streptomyces sp. Ag109_O5-1]RPE38981.1 UDP-glucose pyrophosphorylase [Streptomyces sp. Ag109_O5-1]
MFAHPPVTKAVVPAAGLGTRFLPMTKSTPKEMLPVVDKPAIQYVVEEAAAAGLADVLMITGRNKHSLEDHFDHNFELESVLAQRGDRDKLAKVRASSELGTLHYVRQKSPRGLGHAVLCARSHIGDEPFAVLLGDDLIDPRDALLRRMLDVRHAMGGSVIALMEVDPAQTHLYGCARIAGADGGDVVRVTGLVEKPRPGTQPSNYAVIGRYVLQPEVFGVLERLGPGHGGEIQLTDALETLAAGGSVHGVVFSGRRYDTGDRHNYLRSVVQLACDHPELGPEFSEWLTAYVTSCMIEPSLAGALQGALGRARAPRPGLPAGPLSATGRGQ